jgi:hypothetical protein
MLAPQPCRRGSGLRSSRISEAAGVTDGVGQAEGDRDPALDGSSRSAAACPRCGVHRLALLRLPRIDTTGYRPLDELYGMTGGPNLEEPAIGCLACGAEWPDLATFSHDAERVPGSRAGS